MMGKVFFDGKDTYTEYGLLLASKSISLPEVRTNMIDVPGRDGLLDASEVLTGEVTYKNRTITLKLTGVDTVSGKTWPATISDFCNKVHGELVKITFPEDTAHFYSGRCSVGQVELVKMMQTIPVTVNCEPWKYKAAKTVITQAVSGESTLSLPNLRKRVVPEVVINAESPLHIVYDTYNIWDLGSGSYTLPELELKAGNNSVSVTGEGTISFSYQEAGL